MRTTTILLFLATWLAFLPFHPGHPLTIDSKVTLDTVRAMSRGSLVVPEGLVTRPGRSGNHYSLYGPLLPVVSLPMYKLVSWIEGSSNDLWSPQISWADWAALGTNQWISALLVALIFETALRWGVPFFWALGVSLTIAFSTMILPYSRDYFTQPLAAVCVFWCFQSLWCLDSAGSNENRNKNEAVDSRFQGNGRCPDLSFPRKRESTNGLAMASLMMGMAVLTRMDMLVVVPGFLLSGLLAMRRTESRVTGRGVGLLMVPLLVCLAGLLVFDWYRWGTWFSTPYNRMPFNMLLIDSLPRFLYSHDLSVFLFNPLLIPSLFFLLISWKEYKGLWSGILISSLCYLLFVASYVDYHGGICPGPRYLLALVPVNLMPLLAGLSKPSSRTLAVGAVLAACGLVGLMMNGYAVIVDYSQVLPAWDFWMSFFHG